ncbi:LacI family DNA-binding transcriptional regulator [Bifidobacterium pullorum]|uniref:LacI family DNA-binding transcriptional regulator n=1 Tax=Bifidobacterium pullorum TaxID=78448 RepID=UPI001665D80B|nr:LacI family DNA-binding transcriptional regulator [Bifidobacterium pullorum]
MPDTARRHRASSKSTQLADIAERTGYSLATVSKVLNGRTDVAPQTRKTIEEALRASGYTKRISTTKNRKLIEAVFQNFDNIWSLEVLRGIVHEASAHEMSVVTTESGDRSHPDSRWVEGVLRRQPLQDMAAAAVRMIIDKPHGRPIQNRSIYPTTLIVRDSTRPLEISEPH